MFADKFVVYDNVADANGLKNYTLLDEIDDFDIFISTPRDLMHDNAEGNIPNIVQKFLKKVMVFRVKRMDQINDLITTFDYGFLNHNNLPGAIDMSESLGITASQKIVLFLHFPLIFYELANNARLRPYWLGITSLVGITKILLSRNISQADLDSLDSLVKTHIRVITRVFNCTLKPKQHWLVHYRLAIERMGNPTCTWTMR